MSDYTIYSSGLLIAVIAGFALYWRRRTLRPHARGRSNDEAVLRTLIDNLPDLIYVKDLNGRFLLANVAVARVMGAKTPNALLGKNDFDFHPRDLATKYHEDEQ